MRQFCRHRGVDIARQHHDAANLVVADEVEQAGALLQKATPGIRTASMIVGEEQCRRTNDLDPS